MATRTGSAPVQSPQRPARRVGSVRWAICALLFFAATINYVDRQVIGLLKDTLQQQFGWSEIDYGNIVFAFQLAYAIGYIFAGRVIDRLGTRLGFTLSIALWSLAALGHAEATRLGPIVAPVLSTFGYTASVSVAGFVLLRFLLGLGESANFPAAIKTVAEWFPRRERALATGLFNSGTNIGALMTPALVPWITVHYGWRGAFLLTGGVGMLWLLFWWPFYRSPEAHARVGPDELALIRSDPPDREVPVSWRVLGGQREAWAFALGKFLTDPIWWVYLFWIPDFLGRTYGLSLTEVGPPLVAIYLLADVGSVAGGWLSSALIGRGWSVNASRKTAMLVCALAVTPIVFAASARSVWAAVGLVGLAAAAHQGWSANLFTLTSDMFPRSAIGSVVGFGGTAGAIGGMLISKVTASILQSTGSYYPVFILASVAYLIALLVIQLLVPRVQPRSS